MVAVTGAAGQIGNVLVRELLAQGRQVRAIVHSLEHAESLHGLGVNPIELDVRNRDALAAAFEGVDLVYHLAGIVSISPGRTRLMYRVNVQGTRNVIQACLKAAVRRLVYTSSTQAFVEPPKDVAICETTPIVPEQVMGGYGRSKARATLKVLEAASQGLDALVVFPSGVIGPYDFNPSQMGQLVLDFARGRLIGYLDGAYDFVDVRDVVSGLMLAAEQGRGGQGYILSGARVSVRELLQLLQEVTKVPAPSLRLPFWLARAATAFTPAYYFVTGTKPLFTTYAIRVLNSNCQMDCTKSRTCLGYAPRPIRQTLADTVDWFRATGRL